VLAILYKSHGLKNDPDLEKIHPDEEASKLLIHLRDFYSKYSSTSPRTNNKSPLDPFHIMHSVSALKTLVQKNS